MREITVKLYRYDELPTDRAKERARDWYREGALYYGWWDGVYEDAAQIAEILGIDLYKYGRNAKGEITKTPNIHFSSISCQGDGANFTGSYSYAKDASVKIREYAPTDEALHKIADGLEGVQKRNGYGLTARIEKRPCHYGHETTVSIDVNAADGDVADDDTTEEVADLLRDLMWWIYKTLEKEYEYLTSDEEAEESIRANEYEFEEDGARA